MGLFDEAPVEREVVRDGHAAAEPSVEFGEGSGEGRAPNESPTSDAVDLTGPDRTPGARRSHEGGPFVVEGAGHDTVRVGEVDRDRRNLDDVIGPSVETGRLEVDSRDADRGSRSRWLDEQHRRHGHGAIYRCIDIGPRIDGYPLRDGDAGRPQVHLGGDLVHTHGGCEHP